MMKSLDSQYVMVSFGIEVGDTFDFTFLVSMYFGAFGWRGDTVAA